MDPVSHPSEPDGETRSATLTLQVGSYEVQATLTVPSAPIKPQAVLPALQSLVDAVVGAAERELEGTGRSVSCKPGCAACCRQAVSISAVEAYHIRDLVDAMPDDRRARVLARFANIRRHAMDAGLYDPLMDPSGLSVEQREAMALDYLALDIPCPFLEDEHCSIYADRPLRCREYLVTSPPEYCGTPDLGAIEAVAVPKLSRALLRAGADDGRAVSWAPLSLVLDWVAANPDDLPLHPGPAWVRDILGRASNASAAEPSPVAPAGGMATEPEGAVGVALPMPAGEVSAVDMLATFRAYTEAAVGQAIAYAVAQGKPPSCRAGCAACCHHQLVPISTTEARRLATVVDAMPEPRRTAVRGRFDEADRRLTAWIESRGQGRGLNNDRQTEDEQLATYFGLGISCPLLEDDSCSIYEERPLVCREYLVTTPAENCARLEEPGVVVEPVPRMFTAVALGHLLSDETPPRPSRVLLGQSLRWAAEHPEDESPRRTAEVWLDRFFERLRYVDALQQQGWREAPEDAAPPTDPEPDSTVRLDVPAQPVPVRAVLPAFRTLTDLSVRRAIARSAARGTPVSCREGCSACCNQLVPVGSVEAHALAALVDGLPEPRRGMVRSRFAAAEVRLATWTHRAALDDIDHPQDMAPYQLGVDYFQLGIACPFLENDRCSIHDDRPMACREHLVTSPASRCAQQGDPAAVIDTVPGSNASQALARLDDSDSRRRPLTLALSWAATHPEPATHLPGRIWIERMLAHLRGLR